MGDVQGDFLGPPHDTTPAAVIANKNYIEPCNTTNTIRALWPVNTLVSLGFTKYDMSSESRKPVFVVWI